MANLRTGKKRDWVRGGQARTFAAFVSKEFLHVVRDKRTMLIVLAMPVVQVVLFGFTLSTEIRNVNVAVLAPHYDETVRRIVERMDASDYFTVTGILHSDRDVDRAFQGGTADMVMAFGGGFDDVYTVEGTDIQLIADATNTNTATATVMYASGIIADCLSERSPQERAAGVQPEIRMLYNPQMKSSYSFVPGVMGLIIILICAMMTSVSIVREKETGTMELLLVSPMKPMMIIVSKMMPYLVLSFIDFLIITLLSVTLLDVPMQGSFGVLCLLALLYITAALSLGLLISTRVESQMAAMLVSGMVLMVPSMFFSGMMFPVESMPLFFQWLSKMLPPTWFIIGVKKLMIEGLPAVYVAKEIAILTAMAAVLIAASLKNFKHRLK